MGWIGPPSANNDETPSYSTAYNKILSTHRRATMTSASSVVMFVATNVDALCGAKMLETLFKHDDIGYTIIPVSGRIQFFDIVDKIAHSPGDLHSLILIDMGGNYDLPVEDNLGQFDTKVTVHVIDSARPFSLQNFFLGGDNGERFLVWDDGSIEEILKLKESWELTEYEPESDSDEDDSNSEIDEVDDLENMSQDEGDDEVGSSKKRRRKEQDGTRKRQRTSRISDEEYSQHKDRLNKYYASGSYYGRSVAGIMYTLSVMLEREDNELLWLAILGLTFQYISTRRSADAYDQERALLSDEVARLNPQPVDQDHPQFFASVDPDDISIRATTELRFMLLRHWNLYDSMCHSAYVIGKLGLWKEKGKSRLAGLLAKMGLSISQAQQPYAHMDMDLKKNLISNLEEMAPEYGLTDYTYESFMRCFGFHSRPLSAADAVEGLYTLLEVAEGTKLEIEIEGTRNGGEWFGTGRHWELHAEPTKNTSHANKIQSAEADGENTEDQVKNEKQPWWEKNFWTAYDALSSIQSLRRSLALAMTVHRYIHETGVAIIDRQDIRTMHNHRVVHLSQGPHMDLFLNYGMLRRLALWLIDALRDKLPILQSARSKQKSLPIIIACLNEPQSSYIVVGVSAAVDFGRTERNRFATTFVQAVESCDVNISYSSFDCSIVEIDQKDLKKFLDKVCEL